jgi:hypothetical protein
VNLQAEITFQSTMATFNSSQWPHLQITHHKNNNPNSPNLPSHNNQTTIKFNHHTISSPLYTPAAQAIHHGLTTINHLQSAKER